MREQVRICIIKRLGIDRGLSLTKIDGGVMNLLKSIMAFLNARFHVTIFTTNEDNGPNKEVLGNVEIHRLNIPSQEYLEGMERDYWDGVEFGTKLDDYIPFKKGTFDCYHTHHWSSALFPVSATEKLRPWHVHTPHFLACEKAKMLGIKLPKEVREGEKRILKSSDRIIALSQHEKKAIQEEYGIEDRFIKVIPNGVSEVFFRREFRWKVSSIEATPLRLITIARIAWQKGLDLLIRAIARLRDLKLPVCTTIVGGSYRESNYERELYDLITKLKVTKFIKFMGNLSRQEVARELSKSALYIQPSRYESQGIAIAEAMATGLPVVATQLTAIGEFVKNGVNGYLVCVEGYEALSNAIASLRQQPEIVKVMSKNNRAVAKRFTWKKTQEETIKCFNDGIKEQC